VCVCVCVHKYIHVVNVVYSVWVDVGGCVYTYININIIKSNTVVHEGSSIVYSWWKGM